jgi:hypothetical protein
MDLEDGYRDGRAAIEGVVRARLSAEAAERFLALVRPSVGFAVGSSGAESGGLIGGRLPRTVEPVVWPRYRGAPMVLLAQVDCGCAARLLGESWTLPREGRLLFFHDDDFAAPFDFDNGDDGCRVLHVLDGQAEGQPAGEGLTLPAVPLDACALPSVPTWADAEAEQAVDGDVTALIDLDEALSALVQAPRHRLLGWCDTGDTPRPAGYRPLLQLEAEAGTEWGEVVNVSFWIREEDLEAGELANVRRSYEVA